MLYSWPEVENMSFEQWCKAKRKRAKKITDGAALIENTHEVYTAFYAMDKICFDEKGGFLMLRMKRACDVRRALQRVSNDVLEGKISPQTANAFAYCASTLLNSIRIDEQQRRLEELERTLEETDHE